MTTLLRPEQIHTASFWPRTTLAERTAGTLPVIITRYYPRGLRKADCPVQVWARRMAPTPQLLLDYHNHEIDWEQFTDAYRREMEMADNISYWRDWIAFTLRQHGVPAITLLCHEHDAPEDTVRCHRRLLREMLLETGGDSHAS